MPAHAVLWFYFLSKLPNFYAYVEKQQPEAVTLKKEEFRKFGKIYKQ